MSAGIEFNANVLNQLGTPALNSNLFANRPAAGFTGRIFISTDTREIYRDTGTTWELIGSGGASVNIYNSDGTLTGNRTVTMGNLNIEFLGNNTGSNTFILKNNTSSGHGQLGVRNSSNSAALLVKYGATTPAYKIVQPTDAGLYSNDALAILADAGNIKFSAGSGIAQMTLNTAGRFLLGTTTDAGFLADFNGTVRIQNTLTMAFISGSQLMNLTNNTFNGTLINISHVAGSTGAGIVYTGNGVLLPLSLTTASGTGLANGNFRLIDGTVTYGHYGSTGMGAGFIFNVTSTNSNLSSLSTLWGGRITAVSNASGTTVKGLEITSNSTSGKNIAIETLNGENNYYHAANLTSSNFADRNIWTSHSRLTQTLTAGADQVGAGYYVGGLHIREISASGANTYGNATINAGGASTLQIDFTGAGTLTASQSGLRAFAGHQIFNTFGGSASGTITHFAGMQILGLYNRNSGVITPTITNAYGLVINNLNDYSHTFTLTNRWGLYQTGASDNNYLAGKLLVGTTTVTARPIHIAGDLEFTTTLSGTAGGNSGQHLIIYANGNQYKIKLENP